MAIAAPDAQFEALLEHLRDARSFDFTGYQRASLMRRVSGRMRTLGIDGFATYQACLESDDREFGHLFDHILIHVTGFFRDPGIWDWMRSDLLPRLIDSRAPDRPIRVWCAGVASGEEALSVAMLLAERLGRVAFLHRVTIHATDVDQVALERASQATYDLGAVRPIPPGLLEAYFERAGDAYTFDPELRSVVEFRGHDLTQDPPLEGVDLVVCRNTLIYLNAGARARVLVGLHQALAGGGLLVLGRAETLAHLASGFEPIDGRRWAYRTSGQHAGTAAKRPRSIAADDRGTFADHARGSDAAFDARWVPHVLDVVPVPDRHEGDLGESLTFTDVTRSHELQAELMGSKHELETVVSELRSSNEELATTNEELQTTNEELETVNEELQAASEAMEAMNDELETANRALVAAIGEMRLQTGTLDRANAYLQSILSGMSSAVVVVDEGLGVRVWNRRAGELWGMEGDAVGGPFDALGNGFPAAGLERWIRTVLAGGRASSAPIEALDARGRPVALRPIWSPLVGPEGRIEGVMVLLEQPDQKPQI